MKKLLVLPALFAALAAASVASASPSLNCRVSVSTTGKRFSGIVLRSDHTSCPFARNVTLASLTLILRSGGAGDGDFYVRAYSPVTLKWYRVHCWAHGDIRSTYGMNVDCRAGIGARVIYHARQY